MKSNTIVFFGLFLFVCFFAACQDTPNLVYCRADCAEKVCGEDDGCGGRCATCSRGNVCNAATWQCQSEMCVPNCVNKSCGDDDGCGGRCTKCSPNSVCNAETWQCQPSLCIVDCTNKICGDIDGCGGRCTQCAPSSICNAATWQCQSTFSDDVPNDNEPWDATVHFSVANNPNGALSWGWTATLGSELILFPNHGVNEVSDSPSWFDLSNRISNVPEFWKNASSSEIFGVSPGEVSLHPGCRGEYSVWRWTAPFVANCNIHSQFFSGDGGETEAIVMKNSNLSLFGPIDTGSNPIFDLTVNVSSGDYLDVIVGPSGECNGDNTPINVTITCH